MSEIERFGRYQISLDAGGEPIELSRTEDELICLGFDAEAKHLVELRILLRGGDLNEGERESFLQRARVAMELSGRCLTRVTDVGFDDGIPFYATEFADGERLTDYAARTGGIHVELALSLALQLTDGLIELQNFSRLLLNVDLGSVKVVLSDEAYLRLLIRDYGLAKQEPRLATEGDLWRPIEQVARILYSLIAGSDYEDGNEEALQELGNLPTNLKCLIRQILNRSSRAPVSLEGLRRELKAGLGAVSDGISTHSCHERQIATAPVCPCFCLNDLLLRDLDLCEVLGDEFQVDANSQRAMSPYVVGGKEVGLERDCTLQILPPERIVSSEFYTPIQAQKLARKSVESGNLLEVFKYGKEGGFTYVAEEASTGFPLSRLLAARSVLEPVEALLILREVRWAMEEARESGVEVDNLHPSDVILGLPSGITPRRRDEYLEKRVDLWSEILVKVRTHFTMRSLVVPPRLARSGVADPDHAFVALASLMVSGSALQPGLSGREVPEIIDFLETSLESFDQNRGGIRIAEFLSGFEGLVGENVPLDLRAQKREEEQRAKPQVEVVEMDRGVGELAARVRSEAGIGGEDGDAKAGKRALLVNRFEDPEEFERRQMRLTRSVKLLEVGGEVKAKQTRRLVGMLGSGAAVVFCLAIYGFTRKTGQEGVGAENVAGIETPGRTMQVSEIPESERQADSLEEMGVVAVKIVTAPPIPETPPLTSTSPPEVIRRAIIPGSDGEPTERYDD